MSLTPPDLKCCQAEFRSFMTLGPGMHRCDRPPTVIATEVRAGSDGLHGKMSLCDEHKRVLLERHGEDFAIFEKVETSSGD